MNTRKIRVRKHSGVIGENNSLHDPSKYPDLRQVERARALNYVIYAIESKKKVVSSADIRALASDRLTPEVRANRFLKKLRRLIKRTTTRHLFKGDDTQPHIEDFAYEAIREIAYRTVVSVGLQAARDLVDEAVEDSLENSE